MNLLTSKKIKRKEKYRTLKKEIKEDKNKSAPNFALSLTIPPWKLFR